MSKITSYIRVDSIGESTFQDVKFSIDSLRERYHSVNFVIDFLNAKGDCGDVAVPLVDSLLTLTPRFAFLIGKHTQPAAEHVAMFMCHAGHAISLGDTTPGGIEPSVKYTTNDAYMTQWFDSIQANNILEKSALSYKAKYDVCAKYKDAEDLLVNFSDNGELIDIINDEAGKVGIARNDSAFMYSGYTTVAIARAELVRVAFPDAQDVYCKALNVPISQPITDAMDIMESSRYRSMIKTPRQ